MHHDANAVQSCTVSALTAGRHAGPDGVATLTFTAPDNVGTYNVRAYVASTDPSERRFASVELDILVRRPLSLVPSSPLAVRVGDTFLAGAIATLTLPSAAPRQVRTFWLASLCDVRLASVKDRHFAQTNARCAPINVGTRVTLISAAAYLAAH